MASIYRKSDIPEHLQQYFRPAEIGLEDTPEAYVARLVEVFREVKRVLRNDGTLWLVIGDSYASNPASGGERKARPSDKSPGAHQHTPGNIWKQPPGLKPKDLIGIPWRVAFALQADGWYLRQDIIWHKPNCMPESVTDRCTKAHEYIFLLSKQSRYFYDADAVRETSVYEGAAKPGKQAQTAKTGLDVHHGRLGLGNLNGRNRRSVWSVATRAYRGAHFAVFPPALAEPCVLAGCPVGGTVLDPFAGSGTTGVVAAQQGRSFIGIELNPAYAQMARERIAPYAAQTTLGL